MLWDPWQSKPPPGTGLNGRIGLTQGLAAFWPMLESAGPSTVDLVNQVSLATTSGTTWSSGLSSGLLCTTNGYGATATLPATLQIQPPVTLAVGFRSVSNPVSSAPLFGLYSGVSRELTFETEVSTNALDFIVSSGVILSKVLTLGSDYVAIVTAQSGNSNLYLNGVFQINSASTYTVTYTSPSIYIGGVSAFFNTRNPGCLVYWTAFWNRFLSAGEITAVSSNPWQMLAPNPSYWLYKHRTATSVLFRRTLFDRVGSRGVA